MKDEKDVILSEIDRTRSDIITLLEKQLKYNPNDPPVVNMTVALTNGTFYRLNVSGKVEISHIILEKITADEYLDEMLDSGEK